MMIKLRQITSNLHWQVRRGWSFVLGLVIVLGLYYGGNLALPSLAHSSIVEASQEKTLEAPFWVDADVGNVWNIFGLEIVGKVMSSQTNGKYAVVITTTPSGGGPPLHVHQYEDEMFYILSGTYTFRFGGETIIANQGDVVHLPRQIPHSFRNVGSEPGVTMNMIVPGGFEQFFVEIDQLPKGQPLDQGQVTDIASRYGLRFLPDEATSTEGQ